MTQYTWCITHDLIEGEEGGRAGGTVGRIGPPNGPHDHEEVVARGTPFRLLGVDGAVCYHGYIAGGFGGYEPLDEFGRPYGGCLTIEYLENGEWVARY